MVGGGEKNKGRTKQVNINQLEKIEKRGKRVGNGRGG